MLDGRDPIDEGRLEDDAVSSACKVWDLRQLIQEPAQPHTHTQAYTQSITGAVSEHFFAGEILTVQVCPAV